MYSQATVRSRTKDQAVLRRDHAWNRGKVHRGLQAPWNRTSLSQDHRTSYPLVDKGNSAQSTRTLSHVCTVSQERHSGVWHEAGANLRKWVPLSWPLGVGITLCTCRRHLTSARPGGGEKGSVLYSPSALRSILYPSHRSKQWATLRSESPFVCLEPLVARNSGRWYSSQPPTIAPNYKWKKATAPSPPEITEALCECLD